MGDRKIGNEMVQNGVTQPTKQFSDFDIGFNANPVTGDLLRVFNDNSVKQSVRNIVLTNRFERPFNPEFGSDISAQLFENFSDITSETIKKSVSHAITRYEPRVILQDVEVRDFESDHAIRVTIVFSIINTLEDIEIDVFLERTR